MSRRLLKSVGITATECPTEFNFAAKVISVNFPLASFRNSKLGAPAKSSGKTAAALGPWEGSAAPVTKMSKSPSWSKSTKATDDGRNGYAGMPAAVVTSANLPPPSL